MFVTSRESKKCNLQKALDKKSSYYSIIIFHNYKYYFGFKTQY